MFVKYYCTLSAKVSCIIYVTFVPENSFMWAQKLLIYIYVMVHVLCRYEHC